MPITYYRRRADQEFWADCWRKEDVSRLVEVAESSYLTKLIVENLPIQGRILEAGCGLGQYVIILHKYGYDIEGIDYVDQAINACLTYDSTCSVKVADANKIDVPDKYYRGYISLGVVEHIKEGPLQTLREAHRVLSDDGILLLSTPFSNGLRRLFSWYFNWKNQPAAVSNIEFYQYAFTKKEITSFLKEAGFRPIKYEPYDPGRILKKALVKVLKKNVRKKSGTNNDKVFVNAPIGVEGKHESIGRKLLYSRISLLTFSHMILVVARKSNA